MLLYSNYLFMKYTMKRITKVLFFFMILSAISINGFTQKSKEGSIDIYLLIGQSNMAGRGLITEQYANEQDPRVLMLNQQNEWVTAKHPMHFDKPKAVGVGPGLSFGIAMAKASKKHTIGLVPCAVGGTAIDKWKEGAYDSATKTHPYDDMALRITEAMKTGKVKGIIWHQGESDSKPELAQAYLPKLIALLEKLRVLVNDTKVPIVVGQLGRYKEAYNLINIALEKLPNQVPYTSIATSEDLVDKGDVTHFDSPSAEIFGIRFAKKMKMLQKELKTK